jgi:S-adenosylhomocysteine hydrolase
MLNGKECAMADDPPVTPTSAVSMQTPKYWQLSDEIPRRLPILDRWLGRAAQHRPLAGVTVLMIQHQLGNHVPQAQALLDLGVAPHAVHWIDIPYTSTPTVRDALCELGIPTENMAVNKFSVLDKYAPFQRSRVQHFLLELFENPPELLLVLDDGSYMLEALAGLRRRPRPKIAIVEQTTRGLIKIDENAALRYASRNFPIINVARSRPKMTLEPPFIGIAVTDALRQRFGRAVCVGPKDRCLVLGYGAIGQQVAAFASRMQGFSRRRVYVFDKVKARMRRAKADGFSLWEKNRSLQKTQPLRFRFVIGCSGRASFTIGDYVFLEDGAFLASASSGTVELSREHFIELADSNDDDDMWLDREGLDQTNVHSDLRFHFVDRDATFVNGGFPVNFDGRVNCVPAHYIQPTPTMMCAAAVQAVRSTKKGVLPLGDAFGRWLDAEFRAELGVEASFLST